MTAGIEKTIRITTPENAFAGDEPLVAVMRGGYVGAVHRGTLAAVGQSGATIFSVGDPSQPAFLRSAAKPFQVMPAILSGGIDRFGITEAELAVLCASHSAEPRHTEAVLSVLEKIGLDESALRCGTHAPLHQPTADDRVRHGIEASPICNNCSGAHTGMLAACVANNWPIASYGSLHHPLQQEIRSILATFSEMKASSIETAGDNCHVPTFRLPIQSAALAFGRLAAGDAGSADLARSAEQVVRAMTRNPEMVGGEGRFDTDLMRAGGGSIVAKGGAEAFQGVGLTGNGIGIALKISDGNPRAVAPTIVRTLGELGLNISAALEEHARPELRDLEGARVGELIPLFSFEDGTA